MTHMLLILPPRHLNMSFDDIYMHLILPPCHLSMSFDNIRVRLITLSLIIIMPLFAVLTLPPTYHVEVAAYQVGLPKQDQSTISGIKSI